jgi:dihydroorotate dehydrogenase electron transfer subunit
LRRPFSVHDARPENDWVRLELLGKIVGRGTRLLAESRAGDRLKILGPLGRPFDPPEQLATGDGDGHGERVALVAGGVGSAPLLLLAKTLVRQGITFDFYYGGGSAHDLVKRADFTIQTEAGAG